jgi:hypothetical protein
MAFADEIHALRDRSLTELAAIHDYFTDTKMAWWVVDRMVQAGRKFTVRNVATGTVTDESELTEKARGYVTRYLAEATFQQFVAIFENYFFDLLRLWLTAFPRSLGEKELRFKDVLAAPDKESITRTVVDKELIEIAYERPTEWFAYLETRTRIGCPSPPDIERLAEAKAARDVLAHNRGIANKIYGAKAGKAARYTEGERVEIPEAYHRETWELLRKLIADLSNAAATKFAS